MKNLLIITLLIFPTFCIAQNIDELSSERLSVSSDKTFHLIYPTDVKYISLGNENIAGEIITQCPNTIRLKATMPNFKKETNLSVVTADGKYYSYSINYSDTLVSTYKVIGDSYVNPHDIPVSDNKLMHLIFPKKIVYVDFGNSTINVEKASGVDNIIYLRAINKFGKMTNVSVITDDNKFYTFNIFFSPNPEVLSFVIDKDKKKNERERIALLDAKELNSIQKEKIREDLNVYPRSISRMNKSYAGMKFSIINIFIHNDILFFKFEFKNKSNIDYSIDFARFYIQDSKKKKKTAVQQLEQEPLFFFDFPNQIPAHETRSFTVALRKFTIPDKKNLIIEIQELDGGRHFSYKLNNKPIIHSQILYPYATLETIIKK